MYRLIKDFKPRWVVAENVAGHISMGLDQVLSDLEAEDYACWPFVIPACSVDAWHRRDRVWIVGNTEHDGSSAATQSRVSDQAIANNAQGANASGESTRTGRSECGAFVANSKVNRLQRIGYRREAGGKKIDDAWSRPFGRGEQGGGYWSVEPDVGRVAHGIPDRAHRLKGLGNAVVPQIPEIIGRAIMEIEKAA